MKKIMLVAVLLSFSLISCNAQEKSRKTEQKKDSIQPEVNIRVNKEYDEHGNLIRIDSTYTSFYSNIKSDSILEKQIFEKFRGNFDLNFNSIDSLFMKDFYIEDPFKEFDFYTDDFFENHFMLRQKRIENIFKEMDSLKNSFYKRKQQELKKNKT
jgi:hypothetical protein